MKNINWGIISAVVVVLALLASGFWFSLENKTAKLQTAQIKKGTIEEVVMASGTLVPIKQVNVGAQVNGQIKSLKVKLGEHVKQGQLLAEIDPILQENELRHVESALQNVIAQRYAQVALLRQYTFSFNREKILRTQNASSEAEFEAAQSQVEMTTANIHALDAQIRQAEIAVETAKANLRYTQIIAPIDGYVTEIITKEGQTVVSAQAAPTILVISELDRMLVKVKISEADVVRVNSGETVWFSILGDPKKKYYAPLLYVEPSPTSSSSDVLSSSVTRSAIYYNGIIEVDNTDRVLRPSMTAQVNIILGRVEDTFILPVSSVRGPDSDGRYYVKVFKQENEQSVEIREVTTGLTDRVYVQITSGLNGDEHIVIDNPSGI